MKYAFLLSSRSSLSWLKVVAKIFDRYKPHGHGGQHACDERDGAEEHHRHDLGRRDVHVSGSCVVGRGREVNDRMSERATE